MIETVFESEAEYKIQSWQRIDDPLPPQVSNPVVDEMIQYSTQSYDTYTNGAVPLKCVASVEIGGTGGTILEDMDYNYVMNVEAYCTENGSVDVNEALQIIGGVEIAPSGSSRTASFVPE